MRVAPVLRAVEVPGSLLREALVRRSYLRPTVVRAPGLDVVPSNAKDVEVVGPRAGAFGGVIGQAVVSGQGLAWYW